MALRYPKDQGTEWMNLKRAVNDAFTSANKRIPFTKIGAGILSIFEQVTVEAGALFKFVFNTGITGILFGRHYSGGDPVDGVWIRRTDGTTVFWSFNKVDDGYGWWAFYDKNGHIIFSEDGDSGNGLARPWIPWNITDYSHLTAPPANRTTSAGTFSNVVLASTNVQHPKLRWLGYAEVPAGLTIEVQVINDSTNVVIDSVTSSGGYIGPRDITWDDYEFGTSGYLRFAIRRASGTGTVGFTLVSLMGRQS